MRRAAFLPLAIWALACGAALLAGCSGQPQEEKSSGEPRVVALALALRQGDVPQRSYPGVVRSSQKAELALRVGGPLVEVAVRPGDVVRKGQTLLRIDPRDFQDTIRTLEAELAGAQATLRNAELHLGRTAPLLARGAVAQADFDDAQSAHDSARAAVQALDAQLQKARHALGDTTLVAPFDGLVTARPVENHEIVVAGQQAVILHDITQLEIDVDVPEAEMARLGLDSAATAAVEFPPLGDRRHTARIRQWSAEPDPATRAYRVTFALPAPQGARILPGMTCQVLLARDQGDQGVLTVPASALGAVGPEAGRSAVWVFDPQTATATRREVRAGQLVEGSRVEILDGLREGELVVGAGMDFITEGMALRPLNGAGSGAEQTQ